MGPSRHRHRRRLPRRRARLAPARAPDRASDGQRGSPSSRARRGPPSAASGATPTSCSRSATGSPSSPRCGAGCASRACCSSSTSTRTTTSPSSACAGGWPRFLLEHLPLRMLYPGVPVVTISRGLARGPRRPGGRAPAHPRRLLRRWTRGRSRPARRRPSRRCVYLGRLKQYKRIELLLDVARGDPRRRTSTSPATATTARRSRRRSRERGLGDRVTFHGHVDEDEKARLLARAWVALTASSAEGWCLTVLEAAACGTPTAAHARRRPGRGDRRRRRPACWPTTPDELVAGVRDLVAAARALRDAGRRPRWSAPAASRGTRRPQGDARGHRHGDGRRAARGCARRCARSESGKAAGLAAATLGNNAIQLVFTVVFTRLLGADGLRHAGRAHLRLPDPARRRASRCSSPPRARRRWTASATPRCCARRCAPGRSGCSSRSSRSRRPRSCLREPLADADRRATTCRGRRRAILPTGVLWMLLSLQRGALQGLRAYRPVGVSIVGEAGGRLVFGLMLVGARARGHRRVAGHAAGLHRSSRCGSSASWSARRARQGRARSRCARCARWSATAGCRSSASSCSPRCRTSTSSWPSTSSAATRPAPTPRRRSRPRPSCGWRSASACTCCPRRRGAPRPGSTRGRCCCARSAILALVAAPALLIFAALPRAAAAPRLRARTSPTRPTRCCSSAPR